MRRLLMALALSAGLLVVPSSASAQLWDVGAGDLTAGVFPEEELAALDSSGYPFAVGGGMAGLTAKFAFSVHNGPNGPSGYAVVKNGLAEAQGHVVCYSGNFGLSARQAIFGIRFEKSSGLPAPTDDFPFVFFFVTDSGATGGNGDQLFASQSFGPCSLTTIPVANGPVTEGNIVVKN